jgi:hypothetical protein
MGVYYTHYLFPVPRTFLPSEAQTQAFVADLRARRFLPDETPSWNAGVLRIDVSDWETAHLSYPLTPACRPGYFELVIYRLEDYLYVTSETIDPFDDSLVCRCGASLEYDAGEINPRVRSTCPSCKDTFTPPSSPVIVRNGWTGEERRVRGGALARFALAIECGKAIPPVEDGDITAAVPLLEIMRNHFKVEFDQIGDVSP